MTKKRFVIWAVAILLAVACVVAFFEAKACKKEKEQNIEEMKFCAQFPEFCTREGASPMSSPVVQPHRPVLTQCSYPNCAVAHSEYS